MKDAGRLVKALGALQGNMTRMQQELESQQYEGQSAGGLVKVSMSGKGEPQRVDIDAEVLKEDAETVGDLVVAALRDAFTRKEADAKRRLAGIAGNLLPVGFRLPGM